MTAHNKRGAILSDELNVFEYETFQRNKKLHGVSRLNLPKYILTERFFQLKT